MAEVLTSARVERALYGGNFSAAGGTALAGVLPGELVQADASGLVRILEQSADRVTPECVHFGACGGCQYQHASYPAQLAIKAEILGQMFAQAGLQGYLPWRSTLRLRGVIGTGFACAFGSELKELRWATAGGEAMSFCPFACAP